MAINAGQAVGYLDLDMSGFSNGLRTATQQLNDFGRGSSGLGGTISNVGGALKTAGATMTKYFTVPLLGAGIATGKMAIDTEQSMAKVNSILQLSGKEWTDYEQSLKNGANEIGLAYTDYAEASYQAISAGVEQAEVTNFLNGANKLAKGGLTDLTTATDLLTTVQNSYNLEQKDMAKVSDILIQTQNKGKTTVDELGASMGKIIPTAKGLNIGVEQLGAGYALMTSKGIATAETTTYMNSMFNELGKSGTKVDEVLRDVSGKSFAELQASGMSVADALALVDKHAKDNNLSLADMFGSAEAAKAAQILLGDSIDETTGEIIEGERSSKAYNDMLLEMENSTGSTDRAFNILNDTMKEKLGQSFASLKNALADVGKVLTPLIEFIAELIAKFSEFISNLAETNPELLNFAVGLGVALAVIGPVLLIVGQLCIAIGGLITFFGAGGAAATIFGAIMAVVTSPITLIILAIGALIAIGVLLYKNWDEISAKALEVWNKLVEDFKTWMNNMKEDILNTWNNITTFLSDIWKKICDKALDIWNKLVNDFKTWVNNMKNDITNTWNSITSTLSNIWNGIKTTASNIWTNLVNSFKTWVNNMKTDITNAWNNIKDTTSTIWNNIKKMIEDAWNNIKNIVRNAVDNVKNTIVNVWNTLENILTAPFRKAKEVIDGILGGISNAVSNVLDKINPFTKSVVEVEQRYINTPYSFDDYEMVRNLVKSNDIAKNSIADSVLGVVNSFDNNKSKVSKSNKIEMGKSVVINNTYNSPKPASIRDLKIQDEIQMRRLGMQLR